MSDDEEQDGEIDLTTPEGRDLALRDALRPQKRSDCMPGGPLHLRPCPFLSCRHHLLGVTIVDTGRLHLGGAYNDGEGLEVTAPPEEAAAFVEHAADQVVACAGESCALDVADKGDITLDAIGRTLGITRERVRQLEASGVKRIGGKNLRALKGRSRELIEESKKLREYAAPGSTRTTTSYDHGAADDDSGDYEQEYV